MNENQMFIVGHALNNQNRFYTERTDPDWNDLVTKGLASKHPGWEEDMAYYRVTEEGRKVYGELL